MTQKVWGKLSTTLRSSSILPQLTVQLRRAYSKNPTMASRRALTRLPLRSATSVAARHASPLQRAAFAQPPRVAILQPTIQKQQPSQIRWHSAEHGSKSKVYDFNGVSDRPASSFRGRPSLCQLQAPSPYIPLRTYYVGLQVIDMKARRSKTSFSRPNPTASSSTCASRTSTTPASSRPPTTCRSHRRPRACSSRPTSSRIGSASRSRRLGTRSCFIARPACGAAVPRSWRSRRGMKRWASIGGVGWIGSRMGGRRVEGRSRRGRVCEERGGRGVGENTSEEMRVWDGVRALSVGGGKVGSWVLNSPRR